MVVGCFCDKKYMKDYKVTADISVNGICEKGVLETLKDCIFNKTDTQNSVCLDIGANIGYYSLIQRDLIGKKNKIVAVEPILENVKILRKNLLLNNENSTVVIEGAVSNKNGYDNFYTSNHFNLGTFHFEGSSKKFLNKNLAKKNSRC